MQITSNFAPAQILDKEGGLKVDRNAFQFPISVAHRVKAIRIGLFATHHGFGLGYRRIFRQIVWRFNVGRALTHDEFLKLAVLIIGLLPPKFKWPFY